MSQTFEMSPRGPFDLALQQQHFGWTAFEPDPAALAMAFPVEGSAESAAVVIRQADGTTITGAVHGCAPDTALRAWQQALAVLSLDIDGSGFPAVGKRDAVVARLQEADGCLRPTLFHSPYEAACNFVIGQRISIAQARAIRARMAAESGESITAEGASLAAFPGPQRLLELTEVRGLPAEKLTRLHGIAAAAMEGRLDRVRLRGLAADTALAELQQLRGVGSFSAQGILFRGAGLVDAVTDDPVTKQAVQRLYGLDHLPDQDEVLDIAKPWQPYRTWAQVLLHVWIRGEGGGPAAPARRGRSAHPSA